MGRAVFVQMNCRVIFFAPKPLTNKNEDKKMNRAAKIKNSTYGNGIYPIVEEYEKFVCLLISGKKVDFGISEVKKYQFFDGTRGWN